MGQHDNPNQQNQASYSKSKKKDMARKKIGKHIPGALTSSKRRKMKAEDLTDEWIMGQTQAPMVLSGHRRLAETAFRAGQKEIVDFVEKLFEALSHADFSNGVVAFGVDEGRVRATEFIKDLKEEWQAKLKEM